MTTITRDFDDIYLKPTAKGFEFTLQEHPIAIPLMRVEIDAESREVWDIGKIYFADRHRVEENRWEDILQELEGVMYKQALEFFSQNEKLMSLLQDKVDQEIIPDVGWGDQGEAGRRL
jgi:hypothetical protein